MNDDQLTRDLRAAFRDATDDLTYRGRVPTLRRSPLLAVPAVAAAAALVTIPYLSGGRQVADPPGSSAAPSLASPAEIHTTASPGPTSTEVARAATRTVSRQLRLAGFSTSLRSLRSLESSKSPTGTNDPRRIYAVLHAAVPADAIARPDSNGARLWSGTDPRSGDPALWVQLEGKHDIFALVAPGSTAEALARAFEGEPFPVPAVEN